MAELETVRAPRIRGDLIIGLQRAVNDREIDAIAQPKSKGVICAHKQRGDGGGIVGCAEFAAFQHIEKEECSECGKIKKDPEEPLCIAHAALSVAGMLQDVQTDLFEVDPATHVAPAQHDHDADADAETEIEQEIAAGVEPPDAAGEGESDLDPAIGDPGYVDPAQPVLDGKTGGVVESLYPMTPDPQNAELCVCGFQIDSPVAGALHDARHERYLQAIGEATLRPKTGGDVTRAVAKRRSRREKAAK